ncbi:MAG: hypothetical protein IKJ24_06295 [Clostridia bacterium]|nr:hypothetical protein [Clostridia bacterium]
MTDKLLGILKEKYTLDALDVGDFSRLKASGMKFSVAVYRAEGLGHVSVMRARGFFGLMRMDTLMIVPDALDLPLYSYDRIYAMGNDTLIVELYDTLLGERDLSALTAVKERFAHLSERDPGEHWYDSIKLPESISKKGKKAEERDFDALATEHFCAYLGIDAPAVSDKEKKRELSARYVEGLLSEGGPSTDVFKRELGAERTAELFRKVLFGTGL